MWNAIVRDQALRLDRSGQGAVQVARGQPLQCRELLDGESFHRAVDVKTFSTGNNDAAAEMAIEGCNIGVRQVDALAIRREL
jgi:hypothetical protein